MNKTPKLLPCPFCGEAPKSQLWGDEDEGYYEIICEHTAPFGVHVSAVFAGVHADTEAEAVEAWNRRAPLAARETKP